MGNTHHPCRIESIAWFFKSKNKNNNNLKTLNKKKKSSATHVLTFYFLFIVDLLHVTWPSLHLHQKYPSAGSFPRPPPPPPPSYSLPLFLGTLPPPAIIISFHCFQKTLFFFCFFKNYCFCFLIQTSIWDFNHVVVLSVN